MSSIFVKKNISQHCSPLKLDRECPPHCMYASTFYLKKDHTFFRVEKQVELLPFLLRQMMRNLHPDHSAIYVYEKVQKVTQVHLMGDGALEQILPVLR